MNRDNLRRCSLDDIERMAHDGRISEADVEWYLHRWNTTSFRFTYAYWMDGRIRQRERTAADDLALKGGN